MSSMYDPSKGVSSLLALMAKTQKRKAYFAFHYEDIMRVNNVRHAWKIDHPDAADNRSFYDSSLWESRKLEGSESIKNLIRDGIKYTSAVCVLVGSETWSRPWVRYEIARAVIDKRGLLAVHLNNLRHHFRRRPDPLGLNPLDLMAVGKVLESQPHTVSNQRNSLAQLLARPTNSLLQPITPPSTKYYLFERTEEGWVRYQDYIRPVNLPSYLADPSPGYVTPLSYGTLVYDFVNGEGHTNIGKWIDLAAQRVGR